MPPSSPVPRVLSALGQHHGRVQECRGGGGGGRGLAWPPGGWEQHPSVLDAPPSQPGPALCSRARFVASAAAAESSRQARVCRPGSQHVAPSGPEGTKSPVLLIGRRPASRPEPPSPPCAPLCIVPALSFSEGGPGQVLVVAGRAAACPGAQGLALRVSPGRASPSASWDSFALTRVLHEGFAPSHTFPPARQIC